jgi:hypothetical protein
MDRREGLKKRIANIGYNLAFGTKRHFATYDIIEKTPAYFGVFSFAVGITFLIYKNDSLATFTGASSSVIGFALLYLNDYLNVKEKYIITGKQLNILYGKVHELHEKAKGCQEDEFSKIESDLTKINDEFQNISIHKQVFFSNEYAHFKLFWESQPKWFVDELSLTFWKDKVPAIWRLYAVLILVLVGISLLINCGVFSKISEFISACQG